MSSSSQPVLSDSTHAGLGQHIMANLSSPQIMAKVRSLLSFLGQWIALSLVGLLLFGGLYFFGIRLPRLWPAVLGIISLSAGMSLLAVIDERSSATLPNEPSYPAILQYLLTRKSLLGLLFFDGIVIATMSYYVITSVIAVEYATGSGLVVRLPGQTVHYYPVESVSSWQNTGIKLQSGQLFEAEVSGQVSPGFVQDASQIMKYYDEVTKWQAERGRTRGAGGSPPHRPEHAEITWPYSGPEGYSPDFYNHENLVKRHLGHLNHYTQDSGLTIRGLPHNTIVGIILPEGDIPSSAKENEKGEDYPGYDFSSKQDFARLLNLSSKTYPIQIRAKDTGVLWVVINDADLFRLDNVGTFFLKITIR